MKLTAASFVSLATWTAATLLLLVQPANAELLELAEAPTNDTNSSEALDEDASFESRALPWICKLPADGVRNWFYNSRVEGSYICTSRHEKADWAMLNAYRAGGKEGVHWKYSDGANDNDCLLNWKYYSADGKTLLATVSGRSTMLNDTRKWCALPVYRSGGIKGKQWAYCTCRFTR